jgi:uncharacterized protein YggU (UPF0235/DUF167 family)
VIARPPPAAGVSTPDQPWRAGRGCVIVRVRVTPKSSKDAVDGVEQVAEGPAFRVRVRAVPAEGEANAAVEKLVATWLEVPKGRVAVIQGGKSRVKSLEITGEVDEITARLAARLAALV